MSSQTVFTHVGPSNLHDGSSTTGESLIGGSARDAMFVVNEVSETQNLSWVAAMNGEAEEELSCGSACWPRSAGQPRLGHLQCNRNCSLPTATTATRSSHDISTSHKTTAYTATNSLAPTCLVGFVDPTTPPQHRLDRILTLASRTTARSIHFPAVVEPHRNATSHRVTMNTRSALMEDHPQECPRLSLEGMWMTLLFTTGLLTAVVVEAPLEL